MIDCHTHAFPSIFEMIPEIKKFAPLLDMKNIKLPFGVKIPLKDKFQLGVEDLYSFKKYVPEKIWGKLESVLSLGIAPQILLNGTSDQLLKSMDKNACSKVLLIGGPPIAKNDWILNQSQAHPDRFIPVVNIPSIDLNSNYETWFDEWTALARKGARGFKIHPNSDGVDVDHPAIQALFEVAQKNRLFVILHTGCFDVITYKKKGKADPRNFRHYFEKFKTVPICLAHMNRDEPHIAWKLMDQFENLFIDTSWQPSQVIQAAIEDSDANRILLGSDWPLMIGDLQKNSIDQVKLATDDNQFKKITLDNPMKFIEGSI